MKAAKLYNNDYKKFEFEARKWAFLYACASNKTFKAKYLLIFMISDDLENQYGDIFCKKCLYFLV